MAKKLAAAIAGLALLSIAVAAGWLIARNTLHFTPPKFHRLTFRHGFSLAGRFMPDGQSIVYSAGWDGNPTDVYEQRVDSPESRSLGLPPDTEVLSIAPTGEMAVDLNIKNGGPFRNAGTLAEMAASSSSPRELTTDVTFADWGPDGKQLAVVRQQIGTETVEFPIGKVLYETKTWAGDVRVAPDGQHVAFVDHPVANDDAGSIAVVDLAGKKNTLTKNFTSARGLAWCSSGTEVCFTATPTGSARALYGVTLGGRERIVATIPGSMNLFDVAKDGRVLFSEADERIDAAVMNVKDGSMRASGWLDWSLVFGISGDGKTDCSAKAARAPVQTTESICERRTVPPRCAWATESRSVFRQTANGWPPLPATRTVASFSRYPFFPPGRAKCAQYPEAKARYAQRHGHRTVNRSSFRKRKRMESASCTSPRSMVARRNRSHPAAKAMLRTATERPPMENRSTRFVFPNA